MKFVALAITLLLAVGSEAAPLQADAPSALAHARAALDVYLTQIKESAHRALSQLDDTEYKELKARLVQRVDQVHDHIKLLQANVSPYTDAAVATITETTQPLQEELRADIAELQAELEPKRANLHDVVKKHIDEYQLLLQPVVAEYQTRHQAEMDDLKVKLEPVLNELQKRLTVNIEETKAALIPMVDAVRSKVQTRLVQLKEMAAPYVEEYKDQIKTAYVQAQSQDLTALKAKISPLVEDVKVKIQEIVQTIVAAYSPA